jgi:predicted Zn-dependent protease
MPVPGLDCSFTVMADDTDGGIHEPIALPGCAIFVPARLVLEARSEAEFAGMIAHAIAHRALPHGTAEILYPTLDAQRGLFPGSMAKQQRSRELQADTIAVQAMAKAGVDPEGFVQYLDRVQPSPAQGHVASPLPDRHSRIEALRAIIASMPARHYSRGTEFPAVREELRSALPR